MTSHTSSKDLRRILDAASQLHTCEDIAELPGVMRGAVEMLVPGDIVAYSEFDLANLAETADGPPDLDLVASLLVVSPLVTTNDSQVEKEINGVVPWMVRFAEEHPLFRVALSEPDPPVAKISDFLTLPKFRDLGLFRQFFKPLGIKRQIAICPTRCEGIVTGLTVNRSGRDFSERERECLTLLVPHIRQAFQESVLRADLRGQIHERSDALERLPSAIVCLKENGREIQFETGLARQIFRQCFPKYNSRRLPEELRRWVSDHLRRQGQLDDPKPANPTFKLPTDPGKLTARLVQFSGRSYLLLRLENHRDVAGKLAELGLTPREAEVLDRMRDGGTNPQIAKRLHVSAGTIRTHVERILLKLGVGTRTAAVCLAEEHLRHSD